MSAGTYTVALLTPGGRTASGGIARMVDYCARDWPQDSPFVLRVVDTYGPGSKALMILYALRAFIIVCALLARRRIDILHINLSERLSVWRKGAFVLLGNVFSVPVVLHMHGADFADDVRAAGALHRWLIGSVLRRSRKIIVLGEYWRQFLIGEMGIAPGKIVVLCNAVPDMAQLPARPENGECSLLFLGVIGERKGIPVLLKALGGNALSALPWKMVIAGGGEVATYKKMAEELGIGQRVTFPGLLSESQAREALAAADMLILPSRNEGLPMAILEAISYGCPVISTPVGSIAEAVIDGQTGLLVPPGDAQALEQAIVRLITQPEYRRQLGVQARQLFESKFTIGAYNRTLERIYEEVS